MNPDLGSEHLIGWNWALELCARVEKVTAVVPQQVAESLTGDRRLPANLNLISSGSHRQINSRLPVPEYHRQYAAFLEDAGVVVRDIEASIAHQVTWATPYWGTSLAEFKGPRVLGPVGVSTPIPPWAMTQIPLSELRAELARRTLMKWPGPPVSAGAAASAADIVLAVDRRSAAMSQRAGTRWTPMLADGARPRAEGDLLGFEQRSDLLWAGRMMPRKGAPLAARAFAEALPRLPVEARLIMAGDGADRSKVEHLRRELDLGERLVLLDRIPAAEVRARLAETRALVFSSLRDTFGGVVLEAAEVGTPTVTSLHSGIDGLRSWLPRAAMWGRDARSLRGFVSGLAEGMAEALRVTPDEWTARSRAAHGFAAQHSWDRRADQMVETYERLC